MRDFSYRITASDQTGPGVNAAVRSFNRLSDQASGTSRAVEAGFNRTHSAVSRFTSFLGQQAVGAVRSFFYGLRMGIVGAGVAVAGFVSSSIKQFIDFDKKLRETTGLIAGGNIATANGKTLADRMKAARVEAQKLYTEYSAALKAMSVGLRQTPQALAGGLYEITSAGISNSKQALNLLSIAAKGATAGSTSQNPVAPQQAAKSLIGILNALKIGGGATTASSGQMKSVMDKLFQTVNFGVGLEYGPLSTMMSQSIGTVGALTGKGNANRTLNEMLGAFTLGSQKSLTPGQLGVGYMNAVQKLANPSKAAVGAAADFGLDLSGANGAILIQKFGFMGALGKMRDALVSHGIKPGSPEYTHDINAVFRDVRGQKVVDMLMNNMGSIPGQFGTYGEYANLVGNSKGAVSGAYKEQGKSAAAKISAFKAMWANLQIAMGGSMMGPFGSGMDFLTNMLGNATGGTTGAIAGLGFTQANLNRKHPISAKAYASTLDPQTRRAFLQYEKFSHSDSAGQFGAIGSSIFDGIKAWWERPSTQQELQDLFSEVFDTTFKLLGKTIMNMPSIVDFGRSLVTQVLKGVQQGLMDIPKALTGGGGSGLASMNLGGGSGGMGLIANLLMAGTIYRGTRGGGAIKGGLGVGGAAAIMGVPLPLAAILGILGGRTSGGPLGVGGVLGKKDGALDSYRIQAASVYVNGPITMGGGGGGGGKGGFDPSGGGRYNVDPRTGIPYPIGGGPVTDADIYNSKRAAYGAVRTNYAYPGAYRASAPGGSMAAPSGLIYNPNPSSVGSRYSDGRFSASGVGGGGLQNGYTLGQRGSANSDYAYLAEHFERTYQETGNPAHLRTAESFRKLAGSGRSRAYRNASGQTVGAFEAFSGITPEQTAAARARRTGARGGISGRVNNINYDAVAAAEKDAADMRLSYAKRAASTYRSAIKRLGGFHAMGGTGAGVSALTGAGFSLASGGSTKDAITQAALFGGSQFLMGGGMSKLSPALLKGFARVGLMGGIGGAGVGAIAYMLANPDSVGTSKDSTNMGSSLGTNILSHHGKIAPGLTQRMFGENANSGAAADFAKLANWQVARSETMLANLAKIDPFSKGAVKRGISLISQLIKLTGSNPIMVSAAQTIFQHISGAAAARTAARNDVIWMANHGGRLGTDEINAATAGLGPMDKNNFIAGLASHQVSGAGHPSTRVNAAKSLAASLGGFNPISPKALSAIMDPAPWLHGGTMFKMITGNGNQGPKAFAGGFNSELKRQAPLIKTNTQTFMNQLISQFSTSGLGSGGVTAAAPPATGGNSSKSAHGGANHHHAVNTTHAAGAEDGPVGLSGLGAGFASQLANHATKNAVTAMMAGPMGRAMVGLSWLEKQVGKPYVWGAGHPANPNLPAYDCSGLVSSALQVMGYKLQGNTMSMVGDTAAGPGIIDIGFNDPTNPTHMGIGIMGKWFEAKGRKYGILGPGKARKDWAYTGTPKFHKGGQFRTRNSGGEGEALLKDGELVIRQSPDGGLHAQPTAGSGGAQFIFQGPLIGHAEINSVKDAKVMAQRLFDLLNAKMANSGRLT